MYTGPQIVTSGLVMHLDAANTKSYQSGSTTWFDRSGRGNNGTLTNGPSFSSANKGSIGFDGTNDYYSTGYDLSWNNTNSVSISLYVRPNSLAAHFPFIGKGPSNWEWQIMQKNTSLDFVYWNSGGGHTNGPIPSITNFFVNINDFVNIFLVWNHIDNKYYFYRNSILVNTTTWIDASINQNRTDGINIGGSIYQWGTSGQYWSGNIANVQIYNRALSATEVLKNFNATRSRFGI